MDKTLKTIMEEAITGSLNNKKAELLFNRIMAGDFSEIQLSAILASLRARGESIEEIIGATKAMRNHSRKIVGYEDAIDIVGTGGDGKGTLNISTASAIVVSGVGIKVAKHGNKNISSQSGAANILENLGVNIMMKPEVAQRCLEDIGICFMMAPIFHPAMKNVMSVRNELGIRTVFNILGPMTNPAGVKKQLTGTFSESLLEPMAQTLLSLGTESAWLVHGGDGTDEISISDLTKIVEIKDGIIKRFTLNPTDFGFKLKPFSELVGGNPEFNAAQLMNLLEGQSGAYRDSVLINSAAAIFISGLANNLKEGIILAERSIDEGKALNKLNQLKKISFQDT
ncbi:MAG: anthranilate phosphoribosyltransferase [Rhodobacteraceae bacterium]|nr:anthranilate phosphoribosyltransferase [Paracoccaceae bacterium]